MKLNFLHKLGIFFCLIVFLSACSKDEVNLDGKSYFEGNWEIALNNVVTGDPEYPNTIKVTFKDNGSVLSSFYH